MNRGSELHFQAGGVVQPRAGSQSRLQGYPLILFPFASSQ